MFVTFQTVKKGQTRRCTDEHPLAVNVNRIVSIRPTSMVTTVIREEHREVPLTQIEIDKGSCVEQVLVVGSFDDISNEVIYQYT
ncbi:MAG: hypothetical protein VXZ72_02300 [Chlamydiota bacterium]|nr:hypothetical protein [Chlamydiota bacterium]